MSLKRLYAWIVARAEIEQPVEYPFGRGRLLIRGKYVSFSNCCFDQPVEFGTNDGVCIVGCYFDRAIFRDGSPLHFGDGNMIGTSAVEKQ